MVGRRSYRPDPGPGRLPGHADGPRGRFQQLRHRGRRPGGIRLGAYDKSLALTIDPTLVYGTYLGGNNQENAYGIAVDSTGNAYITGQTASSSFPTTAGLTARRLRARRTYS